MENRNSFPGIGNSILLVLLIIAIQLLLPIAATFIISATGSDINLISENIIPINGVVNIISLGIIIWIGLKKTGLSFNELYPVGSISIPLIISILITCAGLSILLSEVDNIFRMIYPMPANILQVFLNMYSDENIISAFVLLVIVAPLTEELVFRGLIFKGLMSNYKLITAFIVSSLLFAVVHLLPWQYLSAFLFGLYACWLYYQTKSLTTVILGHALMNGISLMLAYLKPFDMPGYTELTANVVLQPLWFDITGFIIFILGIYMTLVILGDKRQVTAL